MSREALRIAEVPQVIMNVAGVTPREAVSTLNRSLGGDQEAQREWRKRAHVAAVMGSCPRSRPSVMSGRHLVNFSESHHVAPLCRNPPLDRIY